MDVLEGWSFHSEKKARIADIALTQILIPVPICNPVLACTFTRCGPNNNGMKISAATKHRLAIRSFLAVALRHTNPIAANPKSKVRLQSKSRKSAPRESKEVMLEILGSADTAWKYTISNKIAPNKADAIQAYSPVRRYSNLFIFDLQ
jgi:hypothetical protein